SRRAKGMPREDSRQRRLPIGIVPFVRRLRCAADRRVEGGVGIREADGDYGAVLGGVQAAIHEIADDLTGRGTASLRLGRQPPQHLPREPGRKTPLAVGGVFPLFDFAGCLLGDRLVDLAGLLGPTGSSVAHCSFPSIALRSGSSPVRTATTVNRSS